MKRLIKESEIVHGIHRDYSNTMDLVPPIHLTSTFRFQNVEHGTRLFQGIDEGYIYTRISNPTVDMLQEKMALLEEGEASIATASGMSAVSSVCMTLVKSGENFVSCNAIYGGTFQLFSRHVQPFNISSHFISPSLSNSAVDIEALIDEKTRFLYIETPANPTLAVIDIELWSAIAQKYHIPLVVDNTFATPYLQNPICLGADIIVHSATKYLGGHGDIVGGIIVGTKDMINHIRKEYINYFGPIMSPFNAWLFMRGIKTLAVRMDRHCANAMTIAKWLEGHPKIEKVYYPGLASHPQHDIARKQMKQFGGMISFEVRGGIEAGKAMMNHVELCILAVSLGDCETLVQHPASMTHSTYSKEEREKAGISDGLIRLSVGLENADDIIADLENALNAA